MIGTKEQLKELKKKLSENEDVLNSHDEAIEYLSSVIVKSKYDRVVETIEKLVQSGPKSIKLEDKERLINAIKSNNTIKQLVK